VFELSFYEFGDAALLNPDARVLCKYAEDKKVIEKNVFFEFIQLLQMPQRESPKETIFKPVFFNQKDVFILSTHYHHE